MKDNLSDKIIEQIDTEQIAPLPRWYFILWRVIFWLFAILSIIIGSLAVAVMLFLFFDYGSHGLWTASNDGITELLLLIPYIWLIVFALFIIISRESIKHTKRGYQYRLYAIILVSIFLSFALGSLLNLAGIGRTTHEFFNRVPFYNYATYDSLDAWNKPSIGRLAGTITSIKDRNNFSIIDFNGRLWHIHLATSTNSTFIPEASSTVRIVGVIEASSSTFIAKMINEWEY